MSELDIVIPVYNEGEGIVPTLRSLAQHVRTSLRVLICYDIDSDTTLPAVEAHRAQYPNLKVEFVKNPARGPHAAVMAGFKHSSAQYVVVMPADDDHNAQIIDSMVAEARAGADLVSASRFMRGGSMVGCPWLKAVLVRTGSFVLHHIARVPTHDVSNGFRLFSRRLLQETHIESTQGFTYSIELLVKAHRTGRMIAEVPAQWIERREGQSRFKVISWLPSYLRWCWYAFVTTYWHTHRALVVLIVVTLVLTAIPALDVHFAIGSQWSGIPPTLSDMYYEPHVETIGTGHLNDGNPYLLEHATDLPLVIFGGAWINAIPLMLGMPLWSALYLNFIIFSIAFASLYYWFLRELYVPKWLAACASALLYVQSYSHVWRPVNLQPVYPDVALLYIGVARLIKSQTRGNIWLLGLATGASFYLFSYLWQIAVATLGLLFFYALWRRQWPLVWATLYSSLIGGVLGVPIVLYTLWLSYTKPEFLESISRFGLVYTHLPMAEVIYSGGWVGLVIALLAFLYWSAPTVRHDHPFVLAALVLALSGLGLWIMQGSNLLTGVLLETGEHVRELILPWLAVASAVCAAQVWRLRGLLATYVRVIAACIVCIFTLASVYYTYYYFKPFVPTDEVRSFWLMEQTYAGPFEWLRAHAPADSVVWADPHDYVSIMLPLMTGDYVLYTSHAMWQLIPQTEVDERYLVASYFANPTEDTFKNDLDTFRGRQDAYHIPKTIERGIKICQILHLKTDCGTPPSAVDLLGEPYFAGLQARFQKDIKPNIKTYLAKYHVSYILLPTADKADPTRLGAVLVYHDDNWRLYKI